MTVVLVGILIFIGLPSFISYGKSADACTKQNLHAIQFALERHNAYHMDCPTSIDTLLTTEAGYLDALPTNDYKAKAGLPPESMRDLSSLNLAEPYVELAGNFAYFPHIASIDGKTKVAGYKLIAFGQTGENYKINKLIISTAVIPILILDSEVDKKHIPTTAPVKPISTSNTPVEFGEETLE